MCGTIGNKNTPIFAFITFGADFTLDNKVYRYLKYLPIMSIASTPFVSIYSEKITEKSCLVGKTFFH